MHKDPREFARLKLALDNILPLDATEHFNFQILTDHLKCKEAMLITDSYSNSPFPFRDTLRALTEMYGQPQHLALKRITKLMDGPNIRSGDIRAFKSCPCTSGHVAPVRATGSDGVEVWLTCISSNLPYDLTSRDP